MKYLYTFYLILFNSLLYSQTNLQLNLELGREYGLFQHNEIVVIQNINGNKIRIFSEIDGYTSYRVIEKNDSSATFEVMKGDFRFMVSSPYSHLYVDTRDEPRKDSNIFDKVMREIVGKKFEFVMSNNGEIKESRLFDVVINNFISKMNFGSEEEKQVILKELNDKIDRLSPHKNLERLIKFFPSGNVLIGDAWDIQGSSEFGFPNKFDREVNYIAKTDSTHVLESKATLNPLDNNDEKNNITNVIHKLSGTENHTIELTFDSNWINKVNGTVELTGTASQITEANDTLIVDLNIQMKEYYGSVKY